MPQPLSIIDRLVAGRAPSEDVATLVNTISRDLLYLLNSWEILNLNSVTINQELSSSVLNYGVVNMVGRSIRSDSLEKYEQAVLKAIKTFEPRLDPVTLEVKAFNSKGPGEGASFSLTIEGELAGNENRRRIVFRSRINTTSGRATLI